MQLQSFFTSKVKLFLKVILVTVFLIAFYFLSSSKASDNNLPIVKPIPMTEGTPNAKISFKGISSESYSINDIIFTISKKNNFANIIDSFPVKKQIFLETENKNKEIFLTDIISLPEGKYYVSYNTPSGFIMEKNSEFLITVDKDGNAFVDNKNPTLSLEKDKKQNIYIVELNFNQSKNVVVEKYSVEKLYPVKNIEYGFYTLEDFSKETGYAGYSWRKLQEANILTNYAGKTSPQNIESNSKYTFKEFSERNEIPFNFSFETDSEGQIVIAKMDSDTFNNYGEKYAKIVTERYFNDENPWSNDGSVFFTEKEFDTTKMITEYVFFALSEQEGSALEN